MKISRFAVFGGVAFCLVSSACSTRDPGIPPKVVAPAGIAESNRDGTVVVTGPLVATGTVAHPIQFRLVATFTRDGHSVYGLRITGLAPGSIIDVAILNGRMIRSTADATPGGAWVVVPVSMLKDGMKEGLLFELADDRKRPLQIRISREAVQEFSANVARGRRTAGR